MMYTLRMYCGLKTPKNKNKKYSTKSEKEEKKSLESVSFEQPI